MWCDNCFLLFPLRAGAIVLAVIMALYQIGGGIFLFKFGDLFFFHDPEASIYGGYAMAQGASALITAIAFSNRSYLFTKLMFRLYPFILVLGAVRAVLMAWELDEWKYRIVGECESGGYKWISDSTNTTWTPSLDHTIVTSTGTFSTNSTTLPTVFCKVGIPNSVVLFTTSLAIDFILMLYFNFLIWRFMVKLQHYPFQKGTGAAVFEQGFFA
ncbi:hypothetical protein G9A89_010337 [Geosiphon pyriformis]|nr:hypothetical protein G9A89_010337 [Geosiphon pyriformis]